MQEGSYAKRELRWAQHIDQEINMASILGILLGFGIGLGCRILDLPLPAPPKLVGALLVVAMTGGFLITDLALS